MSTNDRSPVKQFDVVRATVEPGVALVEASAGTGKTFNIALTVVRLLLEDRADSEPGTSESEPLVRAVGRILVVTFTKAATDELINRIRRVLRLAYDVYRGAPVDAGDATVRRLREMGEGKPYAEVRLSAALAAVDSLAVFTIHSFAKRVLDEYSLESGTTFGTTLLEHEDDIVQQALADWWRQRFQDNPAMARVSVEEGLSPTTFLADYRTWTNWPDAALEPDLPLDGFDRELHAAVQAFAAAWDADDYATRVGAMSWNKGALGITAEQIAALDALASEARSVRVGDPAILQHMAPTLGSLAGLADKATKRSAAQKAAAQAVAGWAEVRYAQAVVETTARLRAVLRADCLRFTHRAVALEKARRQAMGFTDLLVRLYAVLSEEGPQGQLARAVRAQFDAALIDEFQDTDRYQFAIFRTIFHERPLFLIGDPKQAIYGFRGADLQAYVDAADEAGDDQRYSLQRNFRSTAGLVDAVNQLFARRAHPFLQPGIVYPRASAAQADVTSVTRPTVMLRGPQALEITLLHDDTMGSPWFTKREAEDVSFSACVTDIVQLLQDGWQPRSIAVLVRTGYEGRAIESLLRAAGVPAVVSGMDDVRESPQMAELYSVLLAIASPTDSPRVRAALATELWGATHDELRAFAADVDDDRAQRWEAVLNELAVWRAVWVSRGVTVMLERLWTARRVMERWLSLVDGQRRVTNLRHLTELLHQAVNEHHLGVDGVLQWMEAQQRTDERDNMATELRLETDADAVQIVTIHKSKGLEYDIVFCPTLWNARVVTASPVLVQEQGRAILEHGSPNEAERLAAANAARLAEDMRLLYVALTRARRRTYVTWGPVVSGGARDPDKLLATDGAVHSAFGYLLLPDTDIDERPMDEVPHAAASALVQSVGFWSSWLDDMAFNSRGHIAVRRVGSALSAARWEPPLVATVAPVARRLPVSPVPAVRFRTYALTSYTGLTSGAASTRTGTNPSDISEAAARDIDAGPVAVGEGQAPPGDAHAGIAWSDEAASWRELPRTDFRAFPAGAREGTVLHRLFEIAQFADSRAVLRARAADELVEHQLATDAEDGRVDAVADMMSAVHAAPFIVTPDAASHAPPRPIVLRDVAQSKARHEWQFTMPLASAGTPLTADALAACFAVASAPGTRAYAAAVRQLSIRRLHGFLQGFVDLVFEHHNQWYVVDWKSNRLPLEPGSYAPEALMMVMDDHHYTLQAHVYVLAVHRFLRSLLPGYDYDRDMGGVAYAFLRGFGSGASVTGSGWITLRPERVVIDALDACVGQHDVLAAEGA